MAELKDIGDYIVRTPGTLGGRPRIAGHRIGVEHIAVLHNLGHSALDIVSSIYVHLELAEVHAALAYYFANKAAVDADIAANEAAHKGLEAEAAPIARSA